MRKRKRIPVEQRFWQYVNKTDSCWLWTGATRDFGYGVINMGGAHGKAECSHRLSWIIHNGDIPSGMCICHKCDNPLCVNPNHLFLGTRSDNNKDMQSKGRYDKIKRPKGEKHGRSKLTNEQVFSLRQDRKSGMVYRELSQKYNISIASAQRIAIGKDWKHI
jgi:hypothetical protein